MNRRVSEKALQIDFKHEKILKFTHNKGHAN